MNIPDKTCEGQGFLRQFSTSQQRGAVAHQFFASVRAGARSVDEVVVFVSRNAQSRLAAGLYVATQARLIELLTTEAAREFSVEVLRRENLPDAEKARRKAAQRKHYQREASRGWPVTKAVSIVCGRCGTACSRRSGLRFEFDVEQFLCKGCVESLASPRLEDYLQAETLIKEGAA